MEAFIDRKKFTGIDIKVTPAIEATADAVVAAYEALLKHCSPTKIAETFAAYKMTGLMPNGLAYLRATEALENAVIRENPDFDLQQLNFHADRVNAQRALGPELNELIHQAASRAGIQNMHLPFSKGGPALS